MRHPRFLDKGTVRKGELFMEIIFLGTGAGIPSKERNVTSIAVSLLQEINSIWLFDCGEATQHQILHTTIKPRKINKIFITHLHGDHIFGLPGLLSSRSFLSGTDPLTVYGPKGIKQFIETSLAVSGTHLTYPINIQELEEGIIFEDTHFRVICKLLDHGIDSYGFRIVEKDKPGELLTHKLTDIGIVPGPIYKQIKENDRVIVNGKTLYRKDFLGPTKKGRVVTIFGDTRFSADYRQFAENSDVLIHEATFDQSKVSLAKKYYHSTSSQAATLAQLSHVKQLILTHISSRYQKDEAEKLLHDAQNIFPQTLLAHDFYKYYVK